MSNKYNALFGALGLAMRAGVLCVGSDLCEKEIRTGKAKIALVCENAPDNTQKKIANACRTYAVPLIKIKADMTEAALRLGKTGFVSCISVNNASFAKLIENSINAANLNIDVEAANHEQQTEVH